MAHPRLVLVLVALVACLGTRAAAQPTESPPPEAPSPPDREPADGDGEPEGGASPKPEAGPSPEAERLAEAKELFRKGLALQKAGDCERAVVYFLRSRGLVPSVPNTLNAANCLTELGRYDESLELLEVLLTELRDQLNPQERAWLGPEMARLRDEVGSLDVVADGDADLVIDGRLRGRLPLVAPVRVLPGKREVRLVKSGFRPYVSEVEIAAGQTASLRASLEPLTVAGRLRVEAAPGAEVIVDGAPVGTAPWEGVLAPGRHVVQVRSGDEGSAPAEVVVLTGQSVTHEPTTSPLGPEIRVRVEPRSARLRIDGVDVGEGRWRGRLPVGRHVLEAEDEGYLSQETTHEVAIEDRPDEIAITLVADEAHPRWDRGLEGHVVVELLGGPALSPSLGSDAEASCDAVACKTETALGILAGARAGYELPFGLSFELLGGYAAIERRLSRQIDDRFTTREPSLDVATRYALDSHLSVSGGFVGGGLGFRQPLGGVFELGAHLAVGAWFTASRDRIEGTVATDASTDAAGVVGSGVSRSAVDVFVAPELRLGLRFDELGLGLGLFTAIMALEGPTGALGDVLPRGTCDPEADPTSASCAPGEPIVAGERSYSTFVLFVPSVHLSYLF